MTALIKKPKAQNPQPRRRQPRPGLLALILGFSLISAAQAEQHHAVILQYHHVSRQAPALTNTPPAVFAQHMRYLKSFNFNVLPLDNLIEALQQAKPLPDKTVAITFDDAYASVYRQALEHLVKNNWPFTVFVHPDPIDRKHAQYMSWKQLRKLTRRGASIGNHSFSHQHLIRRQAGESERAWRRRVTGDIRRAQQRLDEELGKQKDSPVKALFAYPYGEYSPALKEIVETMGYVGFGQQSGPVGRASDWGLVPRFPLSGIYANPERLPEKLLSLPFRALEANPASPIVPVGEFQPKLHLRLGEDHSEPAFLRSSLTCYVSGQEPARLLWHQHQPAEFSAWATRPLAPGRARYNCTARAKDANRYYWYSQLWIVRDKDGQWAQE